ncbi:3-oxoacid CoA-transferase subunit B [Acrocarpospora sp. B8E8]|uniref:3-oxoacid CoA-transferase subunit B n=1 Tax=Acrocarpospora sp. B8E8 TaxID=3153572 RepID=UPI00325EFE00
MSGRSRLEIAARVAADLADGDYVNVGLGIPLLVPEHVEAGKQVVFHSENGLLGMGAAPAPADRDPDLTEAGKGYTTLRPGAAICDSAMSFALIRSGRLSVTILGALQVSADGDLANWHVPGGRPGVGGAMDLVHGARRVWIAMEHTDRRSGAPKIVEKCEYPLTGRGVVHRVYTDLAVFDIGPGGLVLSELAPGVGADYVRERTGASFRTALARGGA